MLINGREAGRHEGGYLPFTLDIGHLLKDGDNEILVRVEDPGSQPEIPHGKQNWYLQVSGLWQSVTWELRRRKRIESFRITAGADGSFRAEVRPLGKARLEIRDPGNRVVHRGKLEGKLEKTTALVAGFPDAVHGPSSPGTRHRGNALWLSYL